MKKIISFVLASLLSASVFTSCRDVGFAEAESSSVAYADSTWLENRLGEIPDGVTVGTADKLNIDMTDFEDDGYIIRTVGDETVICGKSTDGLDLAVRKYAKEYEKGEADALDIAYHEGYRIGKIEIAGVDISEFTVVNPGLGNANIDFAISELVRLIEKACGVTLAVSDTDVTGHKITFAESDNPDFRYDGYSYEVKDGNVNFVGAKSRGNMYAVWRFLENEIGWTGLIFGDSNLQSADLAEIPEGTAKTEIPAFIYLQCYGNTHKTYTNDKGAPNELQNDFGVMPCACHGMQGNRFCDEDFWNKQICYTDESRYEECLANVTDYIEYRLNIGLKIGTSFKYVDIAQGDNSGYCTCKDCRAVLREEGSNCGAVVRFANRLSEELSEKYYGLYYLIYAYGGSNEAPKVTKPNEWIYITFCFDANCSNHRVDGSNCTTGQKIGDRPVRTNDVFAGWFEGWTDITENLYVWFYELDGVLQQYTFFDNMYYDFRYFYEHNVKGIFFQCQYHGLSVNYIAHMMLNQFNWNPEMTEEEYWEWYDYYLELEFGDGWENVKRYLDIKNTAQDNAECWNCWIFYRHAPANHMYDEWYTYNHYEESIDLMEEAAYLANSRMQEHQALSFSLHVMYQGCFCGYRVAYLENDEEEIRFWCEVYQKLLDRMTLCGFDYKNVMTVDGAIYTYEDDLIHEAWTYWARERDTLVWYSDFYDMESPLEVPT